MTLKLDLSELVKIVKELPQDMEGFVVTKEFLKRASEFFNCTELTVRNFVKRNPSVFETRHGFVRMKKIETIVEQSEDVARFQSWIEEREKVLDECLVFLQVQTPSPYLENILVQVATARDELKMFNESGFNHVLFTLKRDYGYTPSNIVTGSL